MIIPDIEVETPSWTTTPVKRKIDPLATKLLSTGKVFVAGGYARWLTEQGKGVKWLKEKAVGTNYTDIDFFFFSSPSDEQWEEMENLILEEGYKLYNQSQFSVSYSRENKSPPTITYDKVQLIRPLHLGDRRLCGDPETVIGGFDFTVCQAALLPDHNGSVLVSERFLEDNEKRDLIIGSVGGMVDFYGEDDKPSEGVSEITVYFRANGYYKKGYAFPVSELLKLLPNTWMDTAISRRYVIDLMKLDGDHRVTKEQKDFFFRYVVFQESWEDSERKKNEIYRLADIGHEAQSFKRMEYPL